MKHTKSVKKSCMFRKGHPFNYFSLRDNIKHHVKELKKVKSPDLKNKHLEEICALQNELIKHQDADLKKEKEWEIKIMSAKNAYSFFKSWLNQQGQPSVEDVDEYIKKWIYGIE